MSEKGFAMPREQIKDTSTRRLRARSFKFAQHVDGTISDAAIDALLDGLEALDGEYAFALHDEDEGRDHLQGCIRFATQRDQQVVEQALPAFAVRTLSGRRAFTNYAKYLTHDGDYDLTTNFDIEPLFVPQLPTSLDALGAAILTGSITLAEAAAGRPTIYAKHYRQLKDVAEEGARLRATETAKTAAQEASESAAALATQAAKARASRDAEDAANRAAEEAARQAKQEQAQARAAAQLAAWLAAEAAFKLTPEYEAQTLAAQAAKQAREAAAQAKADAEELRWLIAMQADLMSPLSNGKAGPTQRRRRVMEALGEEPTKAGILAWFAEEEGDDEARTMASLDEFRDDAKNAADEVADLEWKHASHGLDWTLNNAIRLRQKMVCAPDLFGPLPAVRPGPSKEATAALTAASEIPSHALKKPTETPAEEPQQ